MEIRYANLRLWSRRRKFHSKYECKQEIMRKICLIWQRKLTTLSVLCIFQIKIENSIGVLEAERALNCEKKKNYKFDIEAVKCDDSKSDRLVDFHTIFNFHTFFSYLFYNFLPPVTMSHYYIGVPWMRSVIQRVSFFPLFFRSTVHISVIDINEYAPVFLQPSYVRLNIDYARSTFGTRALCLIIILTFIFLLLARFITWMCAL